MNNVIYAICGTAFFIAFAFIVATYSTGLAIPFVAIALLFAGLSQFCAQIETQWGYLVAMACVVIALCASITSLLAFVVT